MRLETVARGAVFAAGVSSCLTFASSALANVGPSLMLAPGPFYYALGDGVRQVDPEATVSDPDSPNFNGGVLTVALVSPDPTVSLSIRDGGGISLSGSNVKWNFFTTIGSFAFDGEATTLVVYLNLQATPQSVQALVQAISYQTISTVAPQTQVLHFELTDGAGGSSGVLNKTVEVYSSVGVPPAAAAQGFVIRAWPSPFTTRTTILLGGTVRGPARVSILDVLGREARRWDLEAGASSSTSLAWDGTADGGERLPAGRYYIRVVGPGSNLRGSVILVR
jgi:hypothetical protein